jgi:ankyrin repeat protein
LDAAKALVERGAAINNTNKYGNTPLMSAAYGGKLEMFRYLTERGANINIPNANKRTALHIAVASIVCILSIYYWMKEYMLI